MYCQYFGLCCVLLDKDLIDLWDDGVIIYLCDCFQWLFDSFGVGLFIGEFGVGKIVILCYIISKFNLYCYQVIYMVEIDFGCVDLYWVFVCGFGFEFSYWCVDLWCDIKQCIVEFVQSCQIVFVWIIDEFQYGC